MSVLNFRNSLKGAGLNCASSAMALAIGILLLAACIAKLATVAPFRSHSGQLVSGLFESGLLVFEATLGGLLLLQVWQRQTRFAALLFFSLASVFHGSLYFEGQNDCGCFGALPVSSFWVFWLDILICVSILLMNQISGSVQHAPINFLTFGQKVQVLAGIAIPILIIASFSLFWGVDFQGAIARMRGQPIVIRPTIINLAEGDSGSVKTFEAEIYNASSNSIRIIGNELGCGSNVQAEFPLEIPSGESRAIKVIFKYSGTAGHFLRKISLFSDCPIQTTVPVLVRGKVF
jgi:hypothetical protein